MILLALAASGLAGLAMLAGFIKLERTERSHVVVAIVLSIAAAELLLQGPATSVEIGIFRLPLGAFDARPTDLVLPVALAGRFLGRSAATRVSTTAVLWVAFAFWYGFGAYWGITNGNDVGKVINQLRSVLVLVGVMTLVAGVPARHYVAERTYNGIAKMAVWIAVILYGVRFTVGAIRIGIPFATIPFFGAASPDASIILSVLGTYVVTTQLYSETRRWAYLGAGVMLIFTPMLNTQGASIIAMIGLLGFYFVVSYTSHWRKSVRITGTELMMFVAAFIAIGTLGQLFVGDDLRIVEQVEESLFSQAQRQTSDIRVLLWSEAVDIAVENPGLGQGVGFVQNLPDQWPEPAGFATSHNIFLDIAIRTGFAGVALLTLAMLTAIMIGFRSWLATSELVGAIALVAVGGIVSVLVKGQVESLLDEFRHTIALGVYVGIIGSVARSMGTISALRPVDGRATLARP